MAVPSVAWRAQRAVSWFGVGEFSNGCILPGGYPRRAGALAPTGLRARRLPHELPQSADGSGASWVGCRAARPGASRAVGSGWLEKKSRANDPRSADRGRTTQCGLRRPWAFGRRAYDFRDAGLTTPLDSAGPRPKLDKLMGSYRRIPSRYRRPQAREDGGMSKLADIFLVPKTTHCPAAQHAGPVAVCHKHVEVHRLAILVWSGTSTLVGFFVGVILSWTRDSGYSALFCSKALTSLSELQGDILRGEDCARIFEGIPGRNRRVPALRDTFDHLSAGATLARWWLDRIGHSLKDLLRCSGSSRPIRLTPAGVRLYVGLFDCLGEGRRREQSGRYRVRGSAMLVSDNSLKAG